MDTARNINRIRPMHLTVALAFLFSVFASLFIMTSRADAVLQYTMVRFDNIEVSTATTGTVCARPATVGVETTVRVTFPTGYTVNATPGNHTVSTTDLAWPAGATLWPSIATATNVTGQVVTFPSGDLTVGTTYCFNWTGGSAITTQSGASSTNTGSVATWAGSEIESASYVTQTVTDDDIVVTATVPQTFSFALSANTDALGTLSTGSVTTSPTPRTVTISTNAQYGWMVWAREDGTAGLRSTTASYALDSTAGTGVALSAGTEGYITGVSDTDGGAPGTITVVTAFDYDQGGTDGAGLDNTLRLMASSNGTANNDILTFRNQAAISGTTPAATDYTDTITIVGAGVF